jgi:hypothetical protein
LNFIRQFQIDPPQNPLQLERAAAIFALHLTFGEILFPDYQPRLYFLCENFKNLRLNRRSNFEKPQNYPYY